MKPLQSLIEEYSNEENIDPDILDTGYMRMDRDDFDILLQAAKSIVPLVEALEEIKKIDYDNCPQHFIAKVALQNSPYKS